MVGVVATQTLGVFVQGADELREPLRWHGMKNKQAVGFCLKYKLATIGLGLSKSLSLPIPLIGGLVVAASSLGRADLASRMVADNARRS